MVLEINTLTITITLMSVLLAVDKDGNNFLPSWFPESLSTVYTIAFILNNLF